MRVICGTGYDPPSFSIDVSLRDLKRRNILDRCWVGHHEKRALQGVRAIVALIGRMRDEIRERLETRIFGDDDPISDFAVANVRPRAPGINHLAPRRAIRELARIHIA